MDSDSRLNWVKVEVSTPNRRAPRRRSGSAAEEVRGTAVVVVVVVVRSLLVDGSKSRCRGAEEEVRGRVDSSSGTGENVDCRLDPPLYEVGLRDAERERGLVGVAVEVEEGFAIGCDGGCC